MPRRYAITAVESAVIEGATTYRAKLPTGTSHVAVIPSKVDGTPKYNWCFVLVDTSDLPAVAAVPNIYLLPDFGLDVAMSSMGADVIAVLNTNVAAYDLDGQGLHIVLAGNYALSDSYRKVIELVGKGFEPAFDSNRFDFSA